MQAQVTISSPEAKRIIARALVAHPKVKRALEEGTLAISLGSTNAYVAEEILGERLEKAHYVAGYLDSEGTCVLHKERRLEEVVMERGKRVKKSLVEAARGMEHGDVIIKGANAFDLEGKAGIMLASEVGGTIAKVFGIARARGVDIILPLGMEKLVPWSIDDISLKMGMDRVERFMGVPVGMFPLAGEIVTEEKALELLFGVRCYSIAPGTLDEGHAITFMLEGEGEEVEKAFDFVQGIKGEPPLESPPRDCVSCTFQRCPRKVEV